MKRSWKVSKCVDLCFIEKFGFSLYLLEIIVLLDWLLANLKSSNVSHTLRSSKSVNIRSSLFRSSSFCAISALSQGEPEFPACGPESPDYPDTPAQGPDTPGGKFLVYIPRGWSGWTVSLFLFTVAAAILLFLTLTLNLGAISISPFEGRSIFPPQTPGRLWIRSSCALNGHKGTLNFESPDLPMP